MFQRVNLSPGAAVRPPPLRVGLAKSPPCDSPPRAAARPKDGAGESWMRLGFLRPFFFFRGVLPRVCRASLLRQTVQCNRRITAGSYARNFGPGSRHFGTAGILARITAVSDSRDSDTFQDHGRLHKL